MGRIDIIGTQYNEKRIIQLGGANSVRAAFLWEDRAMTCC